MRSFRGLLSAVGLLALLLVGQVAHAGVIPPPAPNTHVGAGWALMQKVLNGNQVSTILINSDSTGADSNGTGSPYQFNKLATWLGSLNPSNTVYYYQISGSSWAAPSTIQTGTGSGILRIYNGAVSGTQAFYFYGGTTFPALYVNGLAAVPDLLIFNHGKNNDYTTAVQVQAAMIQAAVAQLSNLWPNAGIILLKQNPDPTTQNYAVTGWWAPNTAYTSGAILQSGANAYSAGSTATSGAAAPVCTSSTCSDGTITWTYLGVAQQEDAKVRAVDIAANLIGADVVDNYNLFMAAGNPASYFANTVHQSQLADGLMAARLEADLTNVVGPSPRRSSFLSQVPNLIANARFQTQTGGVTAVPDGWTGTNATIAQYTTLIENGGAYALKVTNTGTGASSIGQTIPAATVKPLLGKWVTLTGRVQFLNVNDVLSCTLEVLTNAGAKSWRTWGMSSSGSYTGGYLWLATSALVPTTDTTISVNLYGTKTGGVAAGNGCIFDHVSLVPGLIAMDAAPTLINRTGYLVAGLPASPTTGDIAYVSDAVACTFLATVTGGGAAFCPVIYNGSAWVGE